MNRISGNQKMNRQLGIGLCLVCLCLGFTVLPAAAEGEASKKDTSSTSQKDGGLSTDSLQKQITDLDGQIQKLREQSLELQEKTRAKLQAQLESLKKQRDTLIPRIEKLRENSESAWQDIKENIQKAIEDLKSSVNTVQK